MNGTSDSSSSSDSDEITDKQIAERFTKRIQRPKDDDDDDDYRMEELMNFSGRYGRGKISMGENDSDSDEDRNEY